MHCISLYLLYTVYMYQYKFKRKVSHGKTNELNDGLAE